MNIKKFILKGMANTAYKEAERNANSACIFLHYQPICPESVKKLKKQI